MEKNWEDIQKYYDNNHTWRDIIKKFKISNETLMNAVKNGFLKTRTKTEANILANKKNPRKHSEETKSRISKSMIQYLKEHPDRVPYLLNHSSNGPSYPEKYFNDIFEGQFDYERYLPISYYHIDFAIVDKKIAIEIDGDQHYLDKKIEESDKRKNKYLEENDWDIIRIKWSDYKKLNLDERKEYIKNLIKYIKNLIDIKPEINKSIKIKNKIKNIKNIEKKLYYCINCGKNIVYNKGSECIKCSHLKQRKVENRPDKEELLLIVKELGYRGAGRKYNVSDNTIRKWLK